MTLPARVGTLEDEDEGDVTYGLGAMWRYPIALTLLSRFLRAAKAAD